MGVSDSNRLAYIPWEACTTRTLEIVGAKKDPEWVRDANGFMKCENPTLRESAAAVDNIYGVETILKRRGIGMAAGDLMSWRAHEKLRRDLLNALNLVPPPGYQRVTIAQARRADEEAFRIMAQETAGGIRAVGGVKPHRCSD